MTQVTCARAHKHTHEKHAEEDQRPSRDPEPEILGEYLNLCHILAMRFQANCFTWSHNVGKDSRLVLSSTPNICSTLSGIPSVFLPQPHDLIKCFVTERMWKKTTWSNKEACGDHDLTVWGSSSGASPPSPISDPSQIQINEVPRDSNSHRGPAEALERPYDLLPKAAFSRRGAGWAAPARGRVPWSGRAPRRLPHSCPLPERRFAPEPAPPSTPELARALPPAGPAARG